MVYPQMAASALAVHMCVRLQHVGPAAHCTMSVIAACLPLLCVFALVVLIYWALIV